MASARAATTLDSWSACIEMRNRAVPGGTVGGLIARTSNPAACNEFAECTAAASVPQGIDTMN